MSLNKSAKSNDRLIKSLIDSGRLTADLETGLVYLDGKQKGWIHSTGYLVFSYHHNGKRRIIRCHRVVWIAGTGKITPNEWEVDHLKGIDKTDNRFAKLEAVPGAVNCRRAWDNGLCSTKNNHMVRDPGSGKFVQDLALAPY